MLHDSRIFCFFGISWRRYPLPPPLKWLAFPVCPIVPFTQLRLTTCLLSTLFPLLLPVPVQKEERHLSAVAKKSMVSLLRDGAAYSDNLSSGISASGSHLLELRQRHECCCCLFAREEWPSSSAVLSGSCIFCSLHQRTQITSVTCVNISQFFMLTGGKGSTYLHTFFKLTVSLT